MGQFKKVGMEPVVPDGVYAEVTISYIDPATGKQVSTIIPRVRSGLMMTVWEEERPINFRDFTSPLPLALPRRVTILEGSARLVPLDEAKGELYRVVTAEVIDEPEPRCELGDDHRPGYDRPQDENRYCTRCGTSQPTCMEDHCMECGSAT